MTNLHQRRSRDSCKQLPSLAPRCPCPCCRPLRTCPRRRCTAAWRASRRRRLLYETRLFPEPEYTFKHALTDEVAFCSLLLERRRVLHARVVKALEALTPDRGAEVSLREGPRPRRTPRAPCPQAGRSVGHGHDACFQRPAPRLTTAPRFTKRWPTPSRPSRPSITCARQRHQGTGHRSPPRCGPPLLALGEYGRRLALWARPRRWPGARRPGPAGRCWPDARALRQTGAPTGRCSGSAGPRARGRARRKRLAGASIPSLGQTYYVVGTSAGQPSCCGEGGGRGQGVSHTQYRLAPLSRAWLARTLSALGAFAEGPRHGEEALRLATLAGPGNTDHGPRRPRRSVPRPRYRRRHPGYGPPSVASGYRGGFFRGIVAGLGAASALQGRLAEGCALLEEAIREHICTGALGDDESLRVACSARSLVWQDAARRPRSTPARDSPARSSRHGARGGRAAPTWRCPGPRRPSRAQASADLTTSRPWPWPRNWASSARGPLPLGPGSLYTTIGRREQARAALSAAIDLSRATDMTFWLPETEAALAQVEGR